MPWAAIPCVEVEIALVRATSDSQVVSATSDSDGRFTLSDIPPGRYLVRIERAGFVTRRQTHNLLANRVLLDLRPGETISDATIPLWPAAVLRGKVLDPSGETVTGARVLVMRVRNGKAVRQGINTAVTD